jgi:hypothetical protein
MPLARYQDFVLLADHVVLDDRGLPSTFEVRVFDSPVGQGEQLERVTIPADLRRRVRDLEERRLDADEPAQVELGAALGNLLLPDYARGLFEASRARIGDDEGLRLRLRLADELADFPWEYAYLDAHRGEASAAGFLGLDPRISIVRHEVIAEPVPGSWFGAPAQRRVVVAMASPEPHDLYRPLDLATEQRALKEALAATPGVVAQYLPDYGEEDGGTAPGVTAKDLLSALVTRADIFHFAGHGEFSKDMGAALGSVVGEGSLLLADEDNQADRIPADRLGQVLAGKGVRLAVLGACESGRRDGQNVWSSVAAALLRAGIPAVVAMQFTVGDHEAAQFAGGLYQALAAGLTIDEAVAMGRTAIRLSAKGDRADRRDWGVPVLYLRNAGGPVFTPVSDAAAHAEALAGSTGLYRQDVRRVAAGGRVVGALVDSVKVQQVQVEQKVREDLEGLVVGAVAVQSEGGRLEVVQEVDTVGAEGILIGAMLVDDDPLEALAKALRAESE